MPADLTRAVEAAIEAARKCKWHDDPTTIMRAAIAAYLAHDDVRGVHPMAGCNVWTFAEMLELITPRIEP